MSAEEGGGVEESEVEAEDESGSEEGGEQGGEALESSVRSSSSKSLATGGTELRDGGGEEGPSAAGSGSIPLARAEDAQEAAGCSSSSAIEVVVVQEGDVGPGAGQAASESPVEVVGGPAEAEDGFWEIG